MNRFGENINCRICSQFETCGRHDIVFRGLKQIIQELAKQNTEIIGNLTIITCPGFEPKRG